MAKIIGAVVCVSTALLMANPASAQSAAQKGRVKQTYNKCLAVIADTRSEGDQMELMCACNAGAILIAQDTGNWNDAAIRAETDACNALHR